MNCQNCGAQIASHLSFCTNCGAPNTQKTAQPVRPVQPARPVQSKNPAAKLPITLPKVSFSLPELINPQNIILLGILFLQLVQSLIRGADFIKVRYDYDWYSDTIIEKFSYKEFIEALCSYEWDSIVGTIINVFISLSFVLAIIAGIVTLFIYNGKRKFAIVQPLVSLVQTFAFIVVYAIFHFVAYEESEYVEVKLMFAGALYIILGLAVVALSIFLPLSFKKAPKKPAARPAVSSTARVAAPVIPQQPQYRQSPQQFQPKDPNQFQG